MQRIAHAIQEILRAQYFLELGLADDRLLHQFGQRVHLVLDLGQPQRRMQVAQAPFALLELRLEQVDRVAVVAMAVAAFLELGLEKLLLVAVENLVDQRLVERGPQLLLTREKTDVEDRGLLLQVVVGRAHTFAHVAHRLADSETRIPERVQNYLGHHFGVGAGFIVVQEQEVDVGLRIELAAAVAPARDHRQALV